MTDASVLVNGLKCLPDQTTSTMLTCDPPSPPNEPKDLNADGDALVVVSDFFIRISIRQNVELQMKPRCLGRDIALGNVREERLALSSVTIPRACKTIRTFM